jgi:hypothetical protein
MLSFPTDKLFASLSRLYGPEYVRPEAVDANKVRLTRFMEKYNPEKVAAVDTILKAYAGKEAEMFATLVKKYGPEPTEAIDPAVVEENDSRSRLTRFLKRWNPNKLNSVDAVLKAYAGREEELFAALVKKYGPEPSVPSVMNAPKAPSPQEINVEDDPTQLPVKERLARFMTKYNVTYQQCLFDLFPQEEQLLQFLRVTFGDYDNRIWRFYIRYLPEELDKVPLLLKNAKGSEDELLKRLEGQYGPEPEPQAPSKLILLRSKRRKKPIVDEAWTDEDEREDCDRQDFAMPPAIVEGRTLLDDSARNPPGDFSGDEGKGFPAEEEYWLRLRLTEEVHGEDEAPSRTRAFTECVPNEDSPPDSPRGEKSPASPMEQAKKTSTCIWVAERDGHQKEKLCLRCTNMVLLALNALWQPVGPGHRHVQSSSHTKEGFLEKLSGGRTGAKWQRRHMRVNDKGIHYYETSGDAEKPKGYKMFTAKSSIFANAAPRFHPKCTDANFYYIVLTVNDTNDEFILRTPSSQEKESWVVFLKSAIERARLTLIGQDTNPARWRARVDGLRRATKSMIERVEERASEIARLRENRNCLRKKLEEETSRVEVLKLQSGEMDSQASILRGLIEEAKERCAALEDRVDLECVEAAEACAAIARERLLLDDKLRQMRETVKTLKDQVIRLKCDVIDYEKTRDEEKLKVQKVFDKWRLKEERLDTRVNFHSPLPFSLKRRTT